MKARSLWLLGSCLAAGCALPPPLADESLDSARSTYRMAMADPEVHLRAPVELQLAERTLAEAERLWKERADPALVSHQSYLAGQRARIAIRTADYRKAEAMVATSGAQRSRILLEARERQIESQKQELDQARRQAAERTRQAEERAAQLGADMKRLQDELTDLKARETERGWVLTLRNDLLFDSGAASLKPGGSRAIDNLAEFMRRHPERGIAIEGFTDSTGSEELNRRLSESRAAAVMQALVARGIEPQRIDARGYGPMFPVASNDTPTGRQLNRRVEVVISQEPRATAGGTTRP